ncbi:restriction endonuclease subunit S [Vibrio parahaemolyticus]|nr:restriction endonuclease subunit S [Vibrio parahaemolyticus]
MTEQMNVPKLRFGEFDGCWKNSSMKEISKINQGLQIPISERHTELKEGRYFYITNEFLRPNSTTKYYIENPSDRVVCEARDILMTRTGNTGQVVTNIAGVFHNNFFKIDYTDDVDKHFLVEFLRLPITQSTILRYAGASTIPDLNHGDFYRIKLALPTLPEQQKIASFLSKVDEKIALLTEKKDKLTEYKKGVMQQLFNGKWEEQDGQLIFIPPTLRFKADDGSEFPDWIEKRLGKVFTRIRRKNKENNQNVLTISAQQGLINQEKYFNKSVSAKDVTGYYLLESGDFAYNKSYSKGYPMGAIKRLNNYDKGVVSTLYICFGLNQDQGFVSDFFEHYFESGLQNRDLSKIAQEGARNHGLLNISVDEFFKDVKLLTPSHDEQIKIANFISTINQKIDLTNSELEKAKEWKKGLLQQMFV